MDVYSNLFGGMGNNECNSEGKELMAEIAPSDVFLVVGAVLAFVAGLLLVEKWKR